MKRKSMCESIKARVTASMLRHLDVPEKEVAAFTEQVKEKKMAELFENFVNDVDMSSLYKIALEQRFSAVFIG